MKFEDILDNLRSVAPKHCDNCGVKYGVEDFTLLRTIDNSAIVHLNCRGCDNTYFINAMVSGNTVASQRTSSVVDIESPDEMRRLMSNNTVITRDDAIDFFNAINSSTGINDFIQNNKVSSDVPKSSDIKK